MSEADRICGPSVCREKKIWNPPKYLLIACLDQSAALFVLQFSSFRVFLSDSKNCLKILHGQLISSHKVPSIGRQGNTFNKQMVRKMLQCNRVLTFIIIILFDLEHQIIVKLRIPPLSTFSPINYLEHRPSPRASFWAGCLFALLLLSLSVCDLLFSHTGWVRSPGGKRGERREGRACTYFPAMTFTRLLCSTVINWGLLPQGQQGVEGTAGMKGQKVSHVSVRCHMWLLPLFVLP